MVTEPHFQLTTKDHSILQAMLERYRGPRGPYLQLLERKLRESDIYFRDDIPAGVVTLNARLTYSVDGTGFGPHQIVDAEEASLPPSALSIRMVRGLALLGLAERASITIGLDAGREERLTVESVLFQPEADARNREASKEPGRREDAGRAENIVSFRPRPARASFDTGPDDDDPGPRAA